MQTIAGGIAIERHFPLRDRRRRETDRRKACGRLIAGELRLMEPGALQVPDAQPGQDCEGSNRDERRDDGQAADHSAIRPSRARCRYSCAISQAFDRRRPPIVSAAANGTQTRCTHHGGVNAASSHKAPTTVIVPTMKIRKAAGPSPTWNVEK